MRNQGQKNSQIFEVVGIGSKFGKNCLIYRPSRFMDQIFEEMPFFAFFGHFFQPKSDSLAYNSIKKTKNMPKKRLEIDLFRPS